MAEIRGEIEIGGRWGMPWRRRPPQCTDPVLPNVKLVVQPLVVKKSKLLEPVAVVRRAGGVAIERYRRETFKRIKQLKRSRVSQNQVRNVPFHLISSPG